MKIAIIGSGFFGTSLAINLSKNRKNLITIFEKEKKILQNASKKNQMRFHLGYHYPRSVKTVNEIKKSNKDFINFYGNSVFGNTKNYYSIAKEQTKTSLYLYEKFLVKNKLKFQKFENKEYFSKNIKGSFIVPEKILNYKKIYQLICNKLKKKNIFLKRNSIFEKKDLKNYDKVIICSYQNNNNIIKDLGFSPKKKFKYELVEKIIIKLPKNFSDKSFIVLDGNFVCVDPLLGTQYHLLSSVKYSKIEKIISIYPKFKSKLKTRVSKNYFKDLEKSEFKNFIIDGSKYLPFLKKAKYIKSFYITRVIKAYKEKTDERTNEIEIVNNKVMAVLSGKWNTCIAIAKEIEKQLNK